MLRFDLLAVVSIVSFLLLWAVAVAAAPRRDFDRAGRVRFGCVLAGTLLCYASASLPLFLAGWLLATLPYLLDSPWQMSSAKIPLLGSTILVAAGTALAASGEDQLSDFAFAAFLIAALLRYGVFPFHFWTLEAFKAAPLPGLSLHLNGHLGAYLLIRFAVPVSPELASEWFPYLSVLAFFTAVYMAVGALAAKLPRQVLGWLWISQASFVLAGLGNRTEEGITGALVQWWVVSFAMTGLMAVYSAMEARTTSVKSPDGYLGLASHAPRFAVFFAVCGLALVGLPGTLGFVAEDLLFHGALSAHSGIGVALPLATALNAITMLRLFATLFLGRRKDRATPIPDAFPRERLALVLTVVLLVASGLVPAVLVGLRTPSAIGLANLISNR